MLEIYKKWIRKVQVLFPDDSKAGSYVCDDFIFLQVRLSKSCQIDLTRDWPWNMSPRERHTVH